MPLLRPLLCLLALTFGLMARPALAISETDLLPVDQAFVLTAKADTRNQITLSWKIAPGYYLYRHRTSAASAGPGFSAGALTLPDGDKHQDEFFGAVETYRDTLTAQLAGQADANTPQISLKVKYQGCADAGICYPPQQRTLTVTLPQGEGATAASGPGLLRGLPGAIPVLSRPGPGGVTGMDAPALPAERAFQVDAIAVDGNQLLLRFTPSPGYYVYRDKTTLALEGANGIALLPARLPSGTAHRDAHFGEVQAYFNQVEIPVPLARTATAARDALLQVEFQGCQQDGICYPPMHRSVAVSIPAGHVTSATERQAAQAAAPTTGTPVAASTGEATPAQVERTRPPADVLAKAEPPRAETSLLLALLLALAGGLVLNLMPCVMPVLSLKALTLADGNRDGGARRRALAYTAGVLLSFLALGGLVLALRGAGQALGWGFQLQQPWVVALLAYVMFAVGLNLSGVFGIGYRLAGVGQTLTARQGVAGDFFTGVLAVVVASPCTAPFMATALTYAFTAPALPALLVFFALGLGLAMPFLLIGFIPGLIDRLPRPGAWMDTLKQALAFPMYLTAVWLVWVVGQQRGVNAIGAALAGAVVLALALWWLQRLQLRSAPLQRALVVVVLLTSLLPLGWIARQPPPVARAATATAGTVPYSAKALADLRAQGRVVFVDMTADWCVTCKANEKAVLDTDAFRQSLKDHDAVLMTGDWTNVDPEITRFLEQHQAVGVPLYVVFPRSGGDGQVLPTVLTQGVVKGALDRAAQP
ncbi:MAG: protein-disulfide reductase DsbD [Pseudoxanthomonas sp.]